MIPALKIGLLGLVFVALAPLQWLALRFGWPLAGGIPVWFHRIARATLGLKVREVGAMAAERPLLIVSNHTSWLDIVTLGGVAPLSFIAKSEVSTWPAVKTLAKLQRTIFVDRARRSATAKVNQSIGARLAGGDPMVLFGEGTTSDGQRTLPFRSALIGAAQAAGGGALIQPVAIAYVSRNGLPVTRTGRAELAWFGDMELAPHLMPLLASGTIGAVIVWGDPIRTGPETDRKRLAADLARWAQKAYAAALHGLV
ncbi:1-acyl-sn-glycerol-3-phosphate acyltransferase [Terrarubrum flagellatum]|uniref:lysophospholipid acyltransferase family protein n=1 Tax=Terrirubrum flagellatum TaxID=2895980 RepID=UPI0031454113